jgi:predicted nucleic-acid-binding protein
MAALDTNVVVRLLVGDDAAQARAAENVVATEACTVVPSVLMECEWVLRGAYKLDAATILASLQDFLALDNISASEAALTQRTLDAYANGVDFADALHAAQCADGQTLVTFDKAFANRAAKAGLRGVRLLKG